MAPAGGQLFILFSYEKYVSVVPHAVRVAWVNIWGVRRVCDTLLMLNVWFAFSALAAFSVLREFNFLKKVPLSFLHCPVTPVWTGRKNQLDRCTPDMFTGLYTTGRNCRFVR